MHVSDKFFAVCFICLFFLKLIRVMLLGFLQLYITITIHCITLLQLYITILPISSGNISFPISLSSHFVYFALLISISVWPDLET